MTLRKAGTLSLYQLTKQSNSMALGLKKHIVSWLKLHKRIKCASFFIIDNDDDGKPLPVGLVIIPSRYLDRFVNSLKNKQKGDNNEGTEILD